MRRRFQWWPENRHPPRGDWSRSDREVKQLYPLLNEINIFAEKLLDKSDEELKNRSIELRTEILSAVEEAKEKAKKEIEDLKSKLQMLK